MRLRLRLVPVLAVPVLVASSLAGPAWAADAPVGGARLTGLDPVTEGPPLPPGRAASYVVADLDSGAVLAAKDPHGRFAPASTLKTLTAVTLIPRLVPDNTVMPAAEDVNVDGSKVGLVRQLAYSSRELFNALLMASGNDAAGALATAVGGQAVAAEMMNEQAERLQARDTHAVNTSGLDAEGQFSSAYDLALIARAGMAMPDFRTYVSTRRAFIAAPDGKTIEIGNHNKLLANYPGALGIKNGYTVAARASFVAAATRDGRTLVVSVMRGEPDVWKEAGLLLDWGFAAQAAGVRPIGRLVDPMPDTPMPDEPAPAPSPPAAAVGAVAPAAATTSENGSSALPMAGGTVLVLGGLVVLRRRAVVRARSRRRAALRPPVRRTAPGR